MSRLALERFLAGVSDAPRRLLMLDYDGTLAPLTADRRRARPYSGVRSALARVRTSGTRLVLVSGRPADEVANLLGMADPPEIWGCHGWERRPPGGATARRAPPPAAARRLALARRLAEAAGAGPALEVKSAALALHWRGLPPLAAAALTEFAARGWGPLARPRGPLRFVRFDGGCELRAAGRDKGDVVRELLAAEGTGVAAAYLGDDVTDEDAFHVLRGRGLPVLVATAPKRTMAVARLRPPEEVLAFLARWAGLSQPGRGAS